MTFAPWRYLASGHDVVMQLLSMLIVEITQNSMFVFHRVKSLKKHLATCQHTARVAAFTHLSICFRWQFENYSLQIIDSKGLTTLSLLLCGFLDAYEGARF